MNIKNLIFIVLAFSATQASAGPFGLDKSMSLPELEKQGRFVEEKEQYWFKARRLSNGNDNFEEYSVLVVPGYGLCKIIAVGTDINSSSYGDELRSRFKDLSDALNAKYGAPSSTYDFLRSGSIWDEGRDFMMGLAKKERTLTHFWQSAKGVALKDNLSAISLAANALSSSKGYLVLTYEFDNIDSCMSARKSKANSNL